MANWVKRAYYKALKIRHYLPTKPMPISGNTIEIPFTIVMMGYNNQKYIKKSIESALAQNYNNFSVIYNEACSTDSSPKILENINHKKLTKRINLARKYKLQNLYESIHTTHDNNIILELDGDDYLKDEFVLDRLNSLYQQENHLIVHCNYKNVPTEIARKYGYQTFSQKTPWSIKKLRKFRSFPWIYSGLRSYYSWLFKKIKKADLIFNNQFSPVCCDVASMLPMLEMATPRIGYIQEELLIRNIDSPINEFKAMPNEQMNIRKQILNKKIYEKIV